MNRKKVLAILILVWIVSVPVIYFFSPIISDFASVPTQNRAAGISYSEREKRFAGFNEMLAEIDENIPIYNVIGNHELKYLDNEGNFYNDYKGYIENVHKPSVAPNSRSPYYWYSWDFNGYHFISLNTTAHHRTELFSGGVPKHLFGGFYTLSQKQVEWLRRDLKNTSAPTIVFCHIPLDDHGLVGYDTITNQKEVRSILSESGDVTTVMQAHSHHPGAPNWNGYKWVENEIPYFYLPPLGAPLGGPKYSTVSLNPNEGRIMIETHSLEESSLFKNKKWELSYNQKNSDFSPFSTRFDVSEGKNQFILSSSDLDNREYSAHIVWENYKERKEGNEPNKVLRDNYASGKSADFNFNPTDPTSLEIENQTEKIIKIKDIQIDQNKLMINYSSESELYKSTLFIDTTGWKKSLKNEVKISVFNDLHWGPKRAELFTENKGEELFSIYAEKMNEKKIDLIVNNGDWIDGQ